MANKYYDQDSGLKNSGGGKYSPPKGSKPARTVNERTANWPGLPGKASPDRSAGVKKVKQFPKSEGV